MDDVDLSDAASTLSSISVDSDLYAGSERSSVTGATGISLTLPSGTDGTTGLEAAAASARSADFRAEALASLTRAFDEGHTIENAAIELKTLRMASNVPLSEVRRIVIPFVLERCVPDKPRETAQVLERWGGLIENLASDDEVEALVVMQVSGLRSSPQLNRTFGCPPLQTLTSMLCSHLCSLQELLRDAPVAHQALHPFPQEILQRRHRLGRSDRELVA